MYILSYYYIFLFVHSISCFQSPDLVYTPVLVCKHTPVLVCKHTPVLVLIVPFLDFAFFYNKIVFSEYNSFFSYISVHEFRFLYDISE